MPIEIRELHIKAIVEDAQSASADKQTSIRSGDSAIPNLDEIVSLCIEKVLEILREKEER
ncbi:MAG: DUF5908 family protein [Bacteroidota bacterium]